MVLEIQMLKNLIEIVEVISSTDFVNNLELILHQNLYGNLMKLLYLLEIYFFAICEQT